MNTNVTVDFNPRVESNLEWFSMAKPGGVLSFCFRVSLNLQNELIIFNFCSALRVEKVLARSLMVEILPLSPGNPRM